MKGQTVSSLERLFGKTSSFCICWLRSISSKPVFGTGAAGDFSSDAIIADVAPNLPMAFEGTSSFRFYQLPISAYRRLCGVVGKPHCAVVNEQKDHMQWPYEWPCDKDCASSWKLPECNDVGAPRLEASEVGVEGGTHFILSFTGSGNQLRVMMDLQPR